MGDVAHCVTGQADQAAFAVTLWEQDAIKTIAYAMALPAPADGRDGHRADHCIQVRRIPASGTDGNAANGERGYADSTTKNYRPVLGNNFPLQSTVHGVNNIEVANGSTVNLA